MGNLVKGLPFGNQMGLSSAAALVGDWMQQEGQKDTNQMNLQVAREVSSANQANAREQMAFQERMSSTQWQRGVKDMEAAGLNPMLAYSQGGASSPSGAAGSAAGATMENPQKGFGRIGEQMMAAASTASQLNLQAKQAENIEAQTDTQRATADEIRERTKTYPVSISQMQQSIEESIQRAKTLDAQAGHFSASAGQAVQQTENLRAALPTFQATVRHLNSMANLNDEQVKLVAEQSKKTVAEVKEIMQRVKQDLPQLEAMVKEMDFGIKQAALGPAQRQGEVSGLPVLGHVQALIRGFMPLVNLFK